MCRVRYSTEVERATRALFDSLSERDRRLYAAAEALKLGHGGVCYLASLFGCSERTIRRGIRELADLPRPLDGRIRRKGGAENAA
jgi:DeoR/GlpR family transcriptional regulator of sugar metabolism